MSPDQLSEFCRKIDKCKWKTHQALGIASESQWRKSTNDTTRGQALKYSPEAPEGKLNSTISKDHKRFPLHFTKQDCFSKAAHIRALDYQPCFTRVSGTSQVHYIPRIRPNHLHTGRDAGSTQGWGAAPEGLFLNPRLTPERCGCRGVKQHLHQFWYEKAFLNYGGLDISSLHWMLT